MPADPSALFPSSSFFPYAVGLFGLGTCYFVWGGQAVFNFPRADSEPERTRVERTMGLWGIWMGGFMQFLTGIWLLTGLSWFPVFTQAPGAYMAGLAFTAYGVHWFAIGYRRYRDASAMPEAWMTIAFAWLSLVGVIAFLLGGDVPVAIVFVLLTLIYVSEMIGRFARLPSFLKLQGVFQLINGIWLMYLTLAFTLAFADGVKLWM